MTIDLNQLAHQLAAVYEAEDATEKRHTIAVDWQARIHRQLQAAGDEAIANPDCPELAENASILVELQDALIDELNDLEDRHAQHEQIKATITELAAKFGLTLADLEKLEHGHA